MMGKPKLHQIPSRDPVTGSELHISALAYEASGITIRDRFEVPRYAKLDSEQQKFLETFLRCRGMLSSMEREMNMSYPTLRSRLDALLAALDLDPVKDERREKVAEKKTKIL